MLLQAQQGEVAMEANLTEPGYSLELSSPVPIGYVSGHLLHCLFGFAIAIVYFNQLPGNCCLAWL